jgi:hypothetical protein
MLAGSSEGAGHLPLLLPDIWTRELWLLWSRSLGYRLARVCSSLFIELPVSPLGSKVRWDSLGRSVFILGLGSPRGHATPYSQEIPNCSNEPKACLLLARGLSHPVLWVGVGQQGSEPRKRFLSYSFHSQNSFCFVLGFFAFFLWYWGFKLRAYTLSHSTIPFSW